MATNITAGNSTNGAAISSDNTGTLAIKTGSGAGTTAISIDASQNVGIGQTNPSNPLHIYAASAPQIRIQDANGSFYVGRDSSSNALLNMAQAYAMIFQTSGTERARIGSGGDYGINTGASINAKLDVVQDSASANGGRVAYFRSTASGDVANNAVIISKFDNNTTTSQIFMKFEVNNTATSCGRINANGANTAAFGSTSDQRVKENIADLPSQLQNILALRPVEFDYIESYGGGHQIGFIAQEMQEVYPDVVSADESEEQILSITGWSKTEARLVKAIQELNAKVDAQAAEIAALKGDA